MLKQFYEAVLPRSGVYTLFLLGPKQHAWADSISELVDMTEARNNIQGVYFAVESFVQPTSRSQNNVQSLRSLRLDIDAGEKKFAKDPDGTYPTQRDALVAARDFFRATKIAPTYVVSSGEGLHIYYCMDADLSPAAWLPLAKRLGELGAEHGLRIDSTCTTDTARILRPIGALHPNGKRVEVVLDTRKIHGYAELKEQLGVTDEPAITRRFDLSINDDIKTVEGPPKSAYKIAEHCPAMREVAVAKGDVQEPLWRAMLGIVKFTVEGADLAHEWSSGYDGYDSDETQAKYDAWAVGPASCAEFAKHTKACSTCEFNGKIKSPIVLGYMTPDQVEELPEEQKPAPIAEVAAPGMPWDGKLPAGFEVKTIQGELTMVAKMKTTKEADDGALVDVILNVPFTRDICWLGQWAEAATSEDSAMVTLHRWDQKDKCVKSYVIKQSLVANQFKLLEELAGKAIVLTHDKKAPQAMNDFVRASLQRMRNLAKRPKITDRFGPRIMPNGELIVAHGKHVIHADGRIEEGMLSEPLENIAGLFPVPVQPSMSGEWGPEVWPDINARAKHYVDFMVGTYGKAGLEKFQLAIMLGLASPLMAFVTGGYHHGTNLPANGLSVSLYSRKSGRGKSALAQAVMLAYGIGSELAKDQNQQGSTDLARTGKLSMWGTMPMVMDEMGSTKESSIANMVSTVANGSGRDRMTKTGGLTTSARFALINLITTNRSQRDMIGEAGAESSAIQHRLLELNVDDIEFSKEATDSYTVAWAEVQRDCAGALGAVIHRLMCEAGALNLNTGVMACVKKASELIGAKQDDRFQYRALGAMLYLQIMLTKAGLAMFDTKAMVEAFKNAHASGLTYIAENVLPTDGVELIQIMLSDLKPNTLITETETHRGMEKAKYDIPLNARIPERVSARHVTSMGWTYVSGFAIREWCSAHRVSERDMMFDCKKAGVLIAPSRHRPNNFSTQMDLFKGTREENTGALRCFKINVRRVAQLTGADEEYDEPGDNVTALTRKQEGNAGPAITSKEKEA